MDNFRDYYNYYNNNYNLPNYNQDNNYLNDYDPYNGFIRGNMFKDLYNGYRSEKPIEIIPQNKQAEMLTSLDALEFAMNDLQLYLDIYPENKQALKKFNEYRQSYNEYAYEYQKQYGPLFINSDALNANDYLWVKSPWPWEVYK